MPCRWRHCQMITSSLMKISTKYNCLTENLPAVKLCGFEETDLSVERVNNSAVAKRLFQDIKKIRTEYNCLAQLALKTEQKTKTIREAYNDMTNLEFSDDSRVIIPYIEKRLKKMQWLALL